MLQQVDTDVLVIGDSPIAKISALMLSRAGIECLWLCPGRSQPRCDRYKLDQTTHKQLLQLGVSLDDPSWREPETSFGLGFGESLDRLYGTLDLCHAQSVSHLCPLPSSSSFRAVDAVSLERALEETVSRTCRCVQLGEGEATLTQERGLACLSLTQTDAPKKLWSRFAIVADSAEGWLQYGEEIGRDAFAPPLKLLQAKGTAAPLGRRALPQGLFWLLHPSALGSLTIEQDGHHWTYHTFLPDASPEGIDHDELQQRLRIALGGGQSAHLDSVQWLSLQLFVARRFRRGALLLVGDAAYRCDSLLGEYLDMGVADANNLTWKLASVLRGQTTDQLLDTYEQERHPLAHQRCHLSHQCNLSAFAVAEAFGIARPLKKRHTPAPRRSNIVMRYLARMSNASILRRLERFQEDPTLQHQVQYAMAQQGEQHTAFREVHRRRYEEGAFLQAEPSPQPPQLAPGDELPWMWLDGRKHHRSTLDLLQGNAFVLLLGQEGEPWQQAARWLQAALSVDLIVQELSLACDDERYGELMELLQLREDGALLLRPDGRIAWHARHLSPHPKRCLLSAFEALYYIRPTRSQPGTVPASPTRAARQAILFQAPPLAPLEQK